MYTAIQYFSFLIFDYEYNNPDHQEISDIQKRKTENVKVISIEPSIKSSTELKQRPSILRQPNENLIQIPSFRKCFQCSKLVKLSEYKLHILKFHKN